MMTTVFKGENKILERSLVASDGTTPFPVASLTAAKVELFCYGRLQKTLILGVDPELRASPTDTFTLILELTTAITLLLDGGELRERWTLTRTNAEYTAQPGVQVDKMDVKEITIS